MSRFLLVGGTRESFPHLADRSRPQADLEDPLASMYAVRYIQGRARCVHRPGRADPAPHPRRAAARGAERRRARDPAGAPPAHGVEAPPRPPGRRVRVAAHRRPATDLPAGAAAPRGGGRLAGALPAPVGAPPRPPRAAPRRQGDAMTAPFDPGPANTISAEPDGERWTLAFVRDLAHPPTVVWPALTEPDELAQWAPFRPDRPLDHAGPVTIEMIDGDQVEEMPGRVHRVE